MDIHKLRILNSFLLQERMIFKIPVYQRNYSWDEKNCAKMMSDIQKIIETGRNHFLGTVIYLPISTQPVTQHIIVDGQQRFTTVTLIIKALFDLIKEDNSYELLANELEKCLYNSDFYGMNRNAHKIKLILNPSDNEQYQLLLNNSSEEYNLSCALISNYEYIKDSIGSMLSHGIDASNIYNAIGNLEVVSIELDRRDDDPQVIFETINSTGKRLTITDLLRNYLLMGEDNQDDLYNNYWCKIESLLNPESNDESTIEDFIMHFLLYKVNQPVNKEDAYYRYVDMITSSVTSRESFLSELLDSAKMYKAFTFGNSEYSEEINYCLDALRITKQTTCYPFLLHIFNDYKAGIVGEEDLCSILKLLFNYFLRRIMCGNTNSLRGKFIYLYNAIFDTVQSNKSNYFDAINMYIHNELPANVHFPTDKEFMDSLQTEGIYNTKTESICHYFLLCLEQSHSRELLADTNLTIEHVMPQTINSEWAYIPSEQYETHLHLLGNLTLTAYNPELSNRGFGFKKEIFIESRAIMLNSDICDKENWDIEAIEKRGARLAERAIRIFPGTCTHNPNVVFEEIEEVTLHDDFKIVSNRTLYKYTIDGKDYRQSSFAAMLMEVFTFLNEDYNAELLSLARANFKIDRARRVYISSDEVALRKPKKIANDIYIETNLSASIIMCFILAVFERLNVDLNIFKVYLKAIINESIEDEE